jgi:peptidoglycan/LPS O-acetylase OafA/YrhL
LPVELAFYAIAPFVVKSIPKLIAIAIASLICRYVTYSVFGEVDPWTYRFLPSEMMFFMLGALAYHASVVVERLQLSHSIGQSAFWFLVVLMISYRPVFGWADQPFWHPSVFYVIFLLCLPFIFQHGPFKRPLFVGLDRWAGEISYMVYLTHIIVVNNLQALTGIRAHSVIAIAITIALSSVLHLISDKIDRRVRSALKRPALASSPAS